MTDSDDAEDANDTGTDRGDETASDRDEETGGADSEVDDAGGTDGEVHDAGEGSDRERVPASGIPERCPECGSEDVVEDHERGELVCGNCGLVLAESRIDHGPEWRAYDQREREARERVGAPTTWRRHDRGLTADVDWDEAYDRSSTLERREQMERLREWQRRMRAVGAERRLRFALGELERMASALDVPAPTREVAAVIFRRARDEGLLPGRSIEAMAAASLYAACRQDEVPRSLDQVAGVSRVDRMAVARAYRQLSRELDLRLTPVDPASFVPQIASELGVSDAVERRAVEIVRETAAMDLTSGKSPKGYAAAALYLASLLVGEAVTQREVSDVANVAEVTIRDRYREQAAALDVDI